MTLRELVASIHDLNSDATIYAVVPWTPDSLAIAAVEPDHGGLPDDASELGMTYFLEVDVAMELFEGWVAVTGTSPTLDDRVERLIKYAENDA